MKRLVDSKKINCVFIAVVLLAIFTSCSKEDKNKQMVIDNTWEVEYIVSEGSAMYPRDFYKPPDIIPIPGLFLASLLLNFTYSVPNQLSFGTGDSFNFLLERNAVSGVVKFRKNEIDFQLKSDEQPSTNQFTITCTDLLENVSQYEVNASKLVLTGNNGKIYLNNKTNK